VADLTDRLREFWDRDSETYDRTASHAAADPVEAAVWRATLLRHLPPPGAAVLDVGAGTGAMSLLAAQLGFRVTALDLSPGMLERARRKAEEQGLDVELVVGSSLEPPSGPFDAVMERHVLWTMPDPVAALRAWRAVTPTGRLVLFEGIYGSSAPSRRLRDAGATGVRKLLGIAPDHHAEYEPEVVAELPLARMPSPVPLLGAVADAGWRNPRLSRLRDVEWARRLGSSPVLSWLEGVPLYAIVADG
jgi:SAM-dependent methyltransferase